MGALDVTTGALKPWAANAVCATPAPAPRSTASRPTAPPSTAAASSSDRAATIEGGFALNPADGSIVWVADCHGDTTRGRPIGGVYYTVGHAHFCGNLPNGFPQTDPWTFHRALAFTTQPRHPRPQHPRRYADFGGGRRPRCSTGTPTSRRHVHGQTRRLEHHRDEGLRRGRGEFPRVNGVGAAGLVRFAVRSIARTRSARRSRVGLRADLDDAGRRQRPDLVAGELGPGQRGADLRRHPGRQHDLDHSAQVHLLPASRGSGTRTPA
jgi:hypothetical protein